MIHAQSEDDSLILRINGIYVDEVVEEGDEGVGATAEIAFIIQQTEDVYQTLGFEIGLIRSEAEDSGFIDGIGFVEAELDTDLIPLFGNYTIGGHLGDTGLFVEGGAGIGIVLVDFDASIDGVGNASDDDTVFGGQFFGRLGYKFTEAARASVGVRYMIADDADLNGVEVDDTLNSVAFDVGLSFAF